MIMSMGKYEICYIYKIHFLRGFPAGRYYIGKRVYNGKDISNDKYTGSGNFCKSYFKKYGKVEGDTYIKEILEINPSKEINDDREVIWIGDLWNTDSLCMNQNPGGEGGAIKGVKRSPETGERISRALKKWHLEHPEGFSREISDEERKNISLRMMGNKYGIGHKLSDKSKASIKECHQHPIYQYDMDGNFIKEWECKSDAVRYYNNNKHIISASTGLRKSAAGYLWSSEKYDVLPRYCNASNTKVKAIIEGKEVVFNTIKEAALYVIGFNQNCTLRGLTESISRCCRGIQKTAVKIKWEYA